MRVDVIIGAKFAIQKSRHQIAEEAVVAREADALVRHLSRGQRSSQQVELCALSGTVDAFEDDEFAARRHSWRTV